MLLQMMGQMMAHKIAGLLLAGGLARRMGGGDKALKTLGGVPILDRIIDLVRPQVGPLALNANGDPARFETYRLPVLPDVIEGFAGPLAGVLTGMEWALEEAPDCDFIATFPTDAPFMPLDLVDRMVQAIERHGADLACASSAGRNHPVVGLWPVSFAADLRKAMVEEDIRKVDRWTARYTLSVVDFPIDPVDPFFNANRLEDLSEAEAMLERLG